MKKKKIRFKHNELVSFITETITEMYVNRLINEQNVTYLKFKMDGPVASYTGTKQDALNAWNNLPASTRNTLKNLPVPIEPFSVIAHSYYVSLPPDVQNFLYGFLYPVKIKNELNRNLALSQGEQVYEFVPSDTKHFNLPEIQICANRQTGKRTDCETGLALDGTHEASGYEVSTAQVVVPSLFGYGESAKMNTKYFCKKYIVGDIKTPEEVKDKVLMHLQQAWSNKTGENLGFNSSKGPDYFFAGSTITEKLEGYNDYDLLTLVSRFIDKKITQQESDYKTGKWRYMVGDKLNPETEVPLSNELHLRYFKEMKNFAAMLLQTDCGFGVGEDSLTNAEAQLREKYGDIFAFNKEKPDNWDEMSEADQEVWLNRNKSELQKQTTLEQQNDVQFWWDMLSIAILVVAVVMTVVSAGTLAPVAAGLVYLSAGMGVASGIFDMWQGEWGWGIMGVTLEVIPFFKIVKMSKYLKVVKISDKKLGEMVEFGLKNGKAALIPKYGKSGKALYKALSENADDLAKILDQNTKEAVDFLKRFTTMDPAEFYLLQQLNKGFKTSMKGISFAKFDKSITEMANILFANRSAFRTLVGKARFSLSLPMKLIGLNLAAMSIVNSVRCFDFEVDITGRDLMMLGQLAPLYPAGAVIAGLNKIEINLDLERVQTETMCTLFALIYVNVSGEQLVSLETELNNVIDGDVTVEKDGDNIIIKIENLQGSGEDGEVTLADLNATAEASTKILDTQAVGLFRGLIESYTDDEDILEYWIIELGGEQEGADALDRLLVDVNSNHREAVVQLWDLIKDTDKVFKHKIPEIEQRKKQKIIKYGL